jgi:glucose/arabinose dehydrogenase
MNPSPRISSPSCCIVLAAMSFVSAPSGLAQGAAATGAAAPYALENAAPGMTFSQPLGLVNLPGDRSRLFVLEKTGCIQVIGGWGSTSPTKRVFLDLTKPRDGEFVTSSECGVLGLAFPPDHATSRRLFVYYSLKIGGKLHQRVSRFQLSASDPNAVDPNSEQPLFSQQDPADNHNGGDLHFGPDGYLYVSTGDGGGRNDQFNTARFINKGFHAAILRIDVDKKPGNLPPNPHPGLALDERGAAFYAIPSDNPFVGANSHHGQSIDPKTVRTEIWATGLRNPWRFSFDPPTGRLLVADVGQNLYEEVNSITKGGDYGWSYREALHPFTEGPGKNQEPEGFRPIEPLFEYPRATGISITGGLVSRGTKLPELQGAYVCADFASGKVLAFRENGGKWEPQTLATEPGFAGIGLDPQNGDLLFANLGQGTLKRLRKASATATPPAAGATP